MRPAWIDPTEYPFEPHWLLVEGGRLHYVDEGVGEPIVMVHGTPTWSFLYRHVIAGLRADYRCVAPDCLGFGLSDKPADAELGQGPSGGAVRRALLVIADIRGYTPFMKAHRTSLAHAQDMVARLLEAVIDAAPGLTPLEIEGDAAFLYAWSEGPERAEAEALFEQVVAMRRAFHACQQTSTRSTRAGAKGAVRPVNSASSSWLTSERLPSSASSSRRSSPASM